ncbi:MAG TPA: NADPH-dependent F420 reductase [Actinomycetota bacterium]|nr:NADPH-dependent F420 reductase [Actinomycetota bacterium]
MAVGRVAIVGGTGDEGFGLGIRWAKAGFDIIVGSRDAERAATAAHDLRAAAGGDATVEGLGNADAVAAADVVVVTVPFSGQAAIYKSIADSVGPETIVVDCTVPVAANVGAKATHTLGVWEGSAAQQALAFLPKGTKMCAAFHSLSAAALNEPDSELEGDVLVVGSKQGKEVLKELTEAIPSLRFVDAGPLENARIIEPITALLIGINHRYGTDRAGLRITGI